MLTVDPSIGEIIVFTAAVIGGIVAIIAILVRIVRSIMHSKTVERAIVAPLGARFEELVAKVMADELHATRSEVQAVAAAIQEISHEITLNSGTSVKDHVTDTRSMLHELKARFELFGTETLRDRQELNDMVRQLLRHDLERDVAGLRYHTDSPNEETGHG